MKKNIRIIPLLFTLVGGSLAAVITYYFQYEINKFLMFIFISMVVFYIIGTIVREIFMSIEKKIKKEKDDELKQIQMKQKEAEKAAEEERIRLKREEEKIAEEERLKRDEIRKEEEQTKRDELARLRAGRKEAEKQRIIDAEIQREKEEQDKIDLAKQKKEAIAEKRLRRKMSKT